jgi:hypothetical protein
MNYQIFSKEAKRAIRLTVKKSFFTSSVFVSDFKGTIAILHAVKTKKYRLRSGKVAIFKMMKI